MSSYPNGLGASYFLCVQLYVAHSTRLFYGSLNRGLSARVTACAGSREGVPRPVLKYYDFALHSPSMTSSRVAMSSYPGLPSGCDRWLAFVWTAALRLPPHQPEEFTNCFADAGVLRMPRHRPALLG